MRKIIWQQKQKQQQQQQQQQQQHRSRQKIAANRRNTGQKSPKHGTQIFPPSILTYTKLCSNMYDCVEKNKYDSQNC
jgi:hypothetical protein